MNAAPNSPYEALGEEGVRALVDRFYDLMDTLPEAATIRRMHKPDLGPVRDKLATFLIGWMGGPSLYRERFGPINVPGVHAPFAIGPEERDAWMTCMRKALETSPLEEPLRQRVETLFAQMAEMCRTREPDGSVRPQFARP